MRLFIALSFHRQFLSELVEIQKYFETFDNDCIMSSIDNLHLTLCFLGEQDDLSFLNDLKKINASSLTLETDKLMLFHAEKKNKVLVLKMKDNQQLTKLVDEICEVLKKHNITFDEKPFVPHITLARKYKGELKDSGSSFVISKEKIDSFSLYQSILENGKEPVYKVLETFHLSED